MVVAEGPVIGAGGAAPSSTVDDHDLVAVGI